MGDAALEIAERAPLSVTAWLRDCKNMHHCKGRNLLPTHCSVCYRMGRSNEKEMRVLVLLLKSHCLNQRSLLCGIACSFISISGCKMFSQPLSLPLSLYSAEDNRLHIYLQMCIHARTRPICLAEKWLQKKMLSNEDRIRSCQTQRRIDKENSHPGILNYHPSASSTWLCVYLHSPSLSEKKKKVVARNHLPLASPSPDFWNKKFKSQLSWNWSEIIRPLRISSRTGSTRTQTLSLYKLEKR